MPTEELVSTAPEAPADRPQEDIDVYEAAGILNVDPSLVRRMIGRGELKAGWFRTVRTVKRADILALAKTRLEEFEKPLGEKRRGRPCNKPRLPEKQTEETHPDAARAHPNS